LRGSGDLALVRQMGKKAPNFSSAQFGRMTLAMEDDEAADPVRIGFLRPNTEVFETNDALDLVQQLRLVLLGDAGDVRFHAQGL
jgi:hypothetical protein